MNNIPKLIDPFNRAITYLRVSVTDRCDFRCVYCMSENMNFLPKADLLTLEELDKMCTAFISQGVEKLRITGGEPLVRRNIMEFFNSISRHLKTGALKELTLTTNGSQLHRFAEQLAEIGIKRINVSLDTLNEEKFSQITRWGRLVQVLKGIDAALAAGIKIKINTVALKDFNEDELEKIVKWCANRKMDLTFIEVMPMGDIGNENRLNQYWPLSDLRKRLTKTWTLKDTDEQTGGPARYVRVYETGQKIGFITPMTHNFCESCNRVRLTCTGELYQCLGQEDQVDLRKVLRKNSEIEPLLEAIHNAISKKPKGHDFDYSRQSISGQMSRHMSHTGG
ncbi:GTP 3',8-cyclase MoaA [Amylibacter sp.]|jgi:cyclic pyranopterin phosphate synthase|nr:GTP 3',8-cyclase MoaA [Rhodobacterales bacterium]MCO4796358.1 GTP 3',8-cyclase MoaA [Amylibacter sp.]MBT4133236.1 GTP 3',8-cyclase MoaA [Rhodobacterales bacterium]MBT6894303.1 GTP 3',8-cyclase MoaA [Rhodobacterales bacterium]MBT7559240.1 GTP 3',8-cyclase MoaA [Rhodobacterales bacterium]